MQLDNLDVPRVNCVNIGGCNWGTLGHLHRGSRSEYRRPLAQPRTEWNCKDLRLTHAMEMQTTGVAVPSMTRISASLIGCKHRVPDTIWNACLGKKAAMVGQSMQRDQCTKAAQKLHKSFTSSPSGDKCRQVAVPLKARMNCTIWCSSGGQGKQRHNNKTSARRWLKESDPCSMLSWNELKNNENALASEGIYLQFI